MRVIDLAEKQKNNEILPKHIRYENEDLYFDGVAYCNKDGYKDFLDILAMNNSALTHLFDEVEIIEEDEFDNFSSYTCNVGRVDESNIEEYIHTLFSQQMILIENQKKIITELNKLKGGRHDD